jgi:HPt (histidine-containing phosphotransfer) domain-containing protein
MDQDKFDDFDALAELLDGDEDSLKEVLKTFLQDVPAHVKAIETDCEIMDWAAAKKRVHQIKPFYGYVGDHITMKLLEDWQQELEKADSSYNFKGRLMQLEVSTRTIIKRLKERFNI